MTNEFLDLTFPQRNIGRLAIQDVNILPMDRKHTLPNHTVIIEDGRICVIAPSASITFDDDITIVEGKGMYLIPGLADMYTHYREPSETPLYLAFGITVTRTSSNSFQSAMGRLAANGSFPSPRVITATPGIDGIGQTGRTDMPDGVPLRRSEDAAQIVRHFAERGYSHIMPFSLLDLESLSALGRASAENGMRMVGNCPNAVSWEEAVKAGMSGFQQCHLIARDHMLDQHSGQSYWDRFDPAPGTKLDFEKIRRLGGFLAKHQAWSLPTLAFHQRASQPVEKSLAHPSLRYVPRSTVNDWETTIIRWADRGRVTPEEWRRLARQRAEAFHRVIGIFHEEGAPQLTCTDGINPYNTPGDVLWEEIENFAKAGMTPFEALGCATSEAARFMNEDADWGTIGVGKRADMVLLRENPFEDIRAIRKVESVFVNGYYLSRSALDGLLEQRATQAAKGAPTIASTALPPADGQGSVVDEGQWTEHICGADFGHLSYRHTMLTDGGWLIEEQHAGANPRRHPARRSSRILLDNQMKVQWGVYEVETFVGREKGTIQRSEVGEYELHHIGMDGFATQETLPGEARVPSEQLSLSFVPRLIQEYRGSTLHALDAEGPRLAPSEIQIATTQDAGLPGDSVMDTEWRLDATRVGQRRSQTYRLHPDGGLGIMTEMTVLLWPRELKPDAAE